MKRLILLLLLCINGLLSFADERKDVIVVYNRNWSRDYFQPLTNFEVNCYYASFHYFDVNVDDPKKNGFDMCLNDIVVNYGTSKPPFLCLILGSTNFQMAEMLDSIWSEVPIFCVGELDYVCDWTNVSALYSDANAFRTPLSDLRKKLNLTLLQMPFFYDETVDMVKSLSPNTENVIFVGGVDLISRECEYNMQKAAEQRNVNFLSFNVIGREFSDLMALYDCLGREKTSVVCKSVYAYGRSDITRGLVEDSIPTYYMDAMYFKGNIGGVAYVPFGMSDYNDKFEQILRQILKLGDRPVDIPFAKVKADPMVVNVEAFDHYRLKRANLPDDAQLVRVPPTFWDSYGYLVWPILVFMLLSWGYTTVIHRKNRSLAEAKSEIERINKEVEAARNKAQHDSKMKSIFLQNMGHDIRNPINAIVGFSQLLAIPDVDLSPEEKIKCGQDISNNADLLMMLMEDILNLVDVENGIYRVVKCQTSCNAICHAAMKCVENRPQSGVELKFFSEVPDDFMINTDPRRVQQVLINFLTNACKHTPSGEIRVGCSLSESPGKVVFSVADTGHGIPPEMAYDIFERFKKLDNIEGHGIGLNICSTISACLGGDVALDTTYTNGARFIFSLPLSTE